MPKILFISHDASRTGAPLLLLALAKRMARLRSDLEFSFLFRTGGTMEAAFAELGDTFVWSRHFHEGLVPQLRKKMAARLGISASSKDDAYKAGIRQMVCGTDIIINNTITNTSLLRNLPLQGKRIFSYLHEMQVVTTTSASADDVKYMADISSQIMVPAVAVQDFLVNTYGLDTQKFTLLPYRVAPLQAHAQKGPKIFTVAFCGTLHWRKGYDLLPQMLKRIVQEGKATDIRFKWIGADKTGIEYSILQHDLQKTGLEGFVQFDEPASDISSLLADTNLLALPSREDAFPLVVIEAASLGIPTIYFEQAGGTGSFLSGGAGIAVPYLDATEMAGQIIRLQEHPDTLLAMGKAARQNFEVYTTHADEALQAFTKNLFS